MRIATRNTSDTPQMNASLILKMSFVAKDTRHSKNSEISKTQCGASLRKITLLRTLDENRNLWTRDAIIINIVGASEIPNTPDA